MMKKTLIKMVKVVIQTKLTKEKDDSKGESNSPS